MTSVKGLGASIGIAIGSSYIYENEINFESPTSISFEVAKSNLIKRFKKQIESFKSKDRIDEAEVLDAYILILEDPEITSQFDENSEISTEKVFEVFSSTASIFDSMEDDYFKQRSEDIISVGKHLIFAMQDKDTSTSFEENTILIANDLTPADTSSMDLNKVSGIILKEGGFTSHAVIVAKNLGIPCVIGLKESVNDVLPGTEIAIDGDSGEVILSPSEEIITDLKRKSENINLVISNFTKDKYEKLGVDFRINVGSSEEINNFEHLFLDSIGLFRSEFIYLDRQSSPTLEDQKKVLSELSEKFKGTIVYRTLDIGGDKQVKYLNLPVEENPFLGVRGIRLSLDNKDIFYSQVRSILESDCIDRVKVMFPMVSTIEDFLDAKNYVNEIAEELDLKTPPLGIMVETPSSALMSDQFSEVVDFISIGTNDLTQYIMAADRGNGNLTKYQNPLHPAVLRAISDVINNCRKNKIEVSVCGEMASDPISALALYILGLRTFSMSPSAAPFVFEILEENFENIPEKFEEKILSATNAEEVTLLIKENIL
ncbi:MAG: phosphoenolpyruvate--protein phosphotransferase [Candidatus Actinomarina sp.]|nr:phosphoenolpyruvate--protein phosphotransferase [Candidatus Actinomarinales bacterium]